jgi:hypothetical protein
VTNASEREGFVSDVSIGNSRASLASASLASASLASASLASASL